MAKKSKIEAIGIDGVCARILDGMSMTAIAEEVGTSSGGLVQWIAADPERSARAREARAEAAKLWDEKATQTIEEARDPFELAKAKELAHHYRWRASKIAPKDYGDKITAEHTGKDGAPIQYEAIKRVIVDPSGTADTNA